MIYFITDNNGFIKIGVTDDLEARLKQLQTGNPHRLSVIRTISTRQIRKYTDYEVENALHFHFRKYNADKENNNSEWFESVPVLKLLKLNDEELNQWLNSELKYHGNEYQTVRKAIYAKTHSQSNEDRLKNLLKKKNNEIRSLKAKIDSLEKAKESLALNRFRGRQI
jgi:predicted GIY-YIG superfamily endonuclease